MTARERHVRRRVDSDLYEVVRRSDGAVVGQAQQGAELVNGSWSYYWVGCITTGRHRHYLERRDLLEAAVCDVAKEAEK